VHEVCIDTPFEAEQAANSRGRDDVTSQAVSDHLEKRRKRSSFSFCRDCDFEHLEALKSAPVRPRAIRSPVEPEGSREGPRVASPRAGAPRGL